MGSEMCIRDRLAEYESLVAEGLAGDASLGEVVKEKQNGYEGQKVPKVDIPFSSYVPLRPVDLSSHASHGRTVKMSGKVSDELLANEEEEEMEEETTPDYSSKVTEEGDGAAAQDDAIAE